MWIRGKTERWKIHFMLLITTTFLCVTMVLARPTELDDMFSGYLRGVNLYKTAENEAPKMKRRVLYEENKDAAGDTKDIPLQSLITDLEHNFFRAASSASSASLNHETVKYNATGTNSTTLSDNHHQILKRTAANEKPSPLVDHTQKPAEAAKNVSSEIATTTTPTMENVETLTDNNSSFKKALFGTTRMQIKEEISVKPHYGGDLQIIPAFEVPQKNLNGQSDIIKLTTITTKANMEANSAKENAGKTNEHLKDMNGSGKDKQVEKITTEAIDDFNGDVTDQPDTTLATTTTTTMITTTTMKKSKAELKESEAELKEKVAEIEAEPVILSARV